MAARKPEEFAKTWGHIMTFFGTEDALQEDVVSCAEDMWKIAEGTLKDWADACAYEGFNVKEFTTLLVQKRTKWNEARHKQETIIVQFGSGGSEKTFSFSNQESLMKDLCFLLLVFLQRGSSWDKIMREWSKL